MTMIIKRKRSDSATDDQQQNQEIPDFGGISLATMANYLMLLSQGAHHHHHQQQHTSPFVCFDSSSPATTTSSSDHHLPTTQQQHRVFECKTCNRQFPSFQALGGHRASHKRPKLQHHDGNGSGTTTHSSDSTTTPTTIPTKPKSHECSICGLEFPIGQALGGHMRRHRAIYTDHGVGSSTPILIPPPPQQQPHPRAHLSLSLKLATSGYNTPVSSPHVKKPSTSIASEMLRRTTSGRATLCLDLNLTPFENGVDQLGKLAPIYG